MKASRQVGIEIIPTERKLFLIGVRHVVGRVQSIQKIICNEKNITNDINKRQIQIARSNKRSGKILNKP